MAIRKDIVDTKNSKLQDMLDEKQLTMAALSRKANVSHEVIRKIRDGLSVRRDKFFAVIQALEIEPKAILPSWNNKER